MKRNLFYLALLALILFTWYVPPRDPDFGWHFKYGEHLFKTGHLLKENIFSYNFAEYKWANSYWLSQLYFYVTYTFLTPIGMGLLTSVIGGICLIFLIKVAKLSRFETFFYCLSLAVMGGSFLLTVRPMFFSTLFLMLVFVILNYKPKWEKFLPLIFMVWANTHADFTLGLFMYGLFSIQRIIEKFRKERISFKWLASTCLLPLTSVFATLINPYGIDLWKTLLKETHPAQFNWIREWLPIETSINSSIFVPFIISSGTFFVYLSQKRDLSKLWIYIASTVFILLSIRSAYFIRHTMLITNLFALAIWDESYNKVIEFIGPDGRKKLVQAGKLIGVVVSVCLLVHFARNVYLSSSTRSWSIKASYPYEAVQFIKSSPPEGNMFNNYAWGGYLIWQLPEYKTFIDGRMASWEKDGKRMLTIYKDIFDKPESNYDRPEFAEVAWVVVPTKSKLAGYLKEKGWQIRYEDNIAVVAFR
ncbi:MAG: hypothetical protein WC243_00270 [Patescibacteria group bacterium]